MIQMTKAEAVRVADFLYEGLAKSGNLSPLTRSNKGPTSTAPASVPNPTPLKGKPGLGEAGVKPEGTTGLGSKLSEHIATIKKLSTGMAIDAAGGTGGGPKAHGFQHDSARGGIKGTRSTPSSIPKTRPGIALAALLSDGPAAQPTVKTQRSVRTVKPAIIKSTQEKA